MRYLMPIASLLTLSFAGSGCFAADTNPPADAPAATAPADGNANGRNAGTVPADNSGINQRDQGNHTLTPPDQATVPSNDNKADITVLAAVRRSIVNDKDLSTDAHNVKLTVKDGVVTLRGPVADQNEKNTIEGLAAKVDGVKKVDDQLDIADKNK